MAFTVEGRPIPQGSHAIMRGRIVPVNAKALNVWRKAVMVAAAGAIASGWQPDGPKEVHVVFHMKRPINQIRRNGELKGWAPALPVKRPDLDKLARAIGDSITSAGVLLDDSQIVRWELDKAYAQAWSTSITVMDVEEGQGREQ